MRPLAATVMFALAIGFPITASAQQSLSNVLSFLLINRSVVTGDVARDEAATAATRDVVVRFMLAELSTLPTNSPASGFTYRLDSGLGVSTRSSPSFGPFFLERSLTGGKGQVSFGLTYNNASFANMDGRTLGDGTLIATGSRIVGEAQPFDAETLTLHLRTRIVTVSGLAGVTDRIDISGAVPVVTVRVDGRRVDTYRGTSVVQATAAANASGVGDVRVGAKYNVLRSGGSGLAFAAEARLPTGDVESLRGSGQTVLTPRVIGSWERDRLAVHSNFGYAMGGQSDEMHYAGAFTVAATDRLTVITEIIGARFAFGGRLVDRVESHPMLAGVETIRLSSTPDATTRLQMAAGVRWNVSTKWLLSMNVLKPLTTAGLNARYMTTASFDYAFGD